ncbi:MAG: hypothetical protein ACI4QR_04430, partial [Eubacteriales bacterium]
FLPPVNLHSKEFWVFLTIVLAIYLIPFGVFNLFKVYSLPGSAARIEFSPATKALKTKIMLICLALPLAIMIIGGIFSSTIFNAKRYANVISVTEADFAEDMPETDTVTNIALMDTSSAIIIGNRALGSLSDVVSQYVSSEQYTQINYKGFPEKVSTIEYDGFFKWLGNHKNGVPGYIMVDPVNNTAKYNELERPMKYVNSAYFSEDLARKLRFSYPTKIFGTTAFEIDENGNPFFIVACMKPRVGLFGAYDVNEVIIFNPCDGSSELYKVGDVPRWVDIVYDGYLAEQKYDWHGTLSGGFINSIIGNRGCKQTTDDFGYLMYDDDVWYYTGVTSVTNDASNIGFIVSNARTGEYKYYSVIGAEEYSAMGAAEGEVQEKGYKASFPALINVSGKATYIMVLKDESGLVKLYALVNVEQYSLVATGSTQAEAITAYKKLLSQNGIINKDESEKDFIKLTVNEIEKCVLDGNSWWYFLCSDGNYYRKSISEDASVLFIREGDEIEFAYSETETPGIRNIIAFKKAE